MLVASVVDIEFHTKKDFLRYPETPNFVLRLLIHSQIFMCKTMTEARRYSRVASCFKLPEENNSGLKGDTFKYYLIASRQKRKKKKSDIFFIFIQIFIFIKNKNFVQVAAIEAALKTSAQNSFVNARFPSKTV